MVHITSQQTIHLVIYNVIWWTIQNTINRALQITITNPLMTGGNKKVTNT